MDMSQPVGSFARGFLSGNLVESRYYSPLYNTAIFDGPIRIYFAQEEESLALKTYFGLQSRLKEEYSALKESMKYRGQTAYLMLCPNPEIFAASFGSDVTADSPEQQIRASLKEDLIVGFHGPLSDVELDAIVQRVAHLLREIRTRSTVEQAALEV